MYEINKWDERFETAHTRKRQRLGWYMAPSGTDSKGYRKLMRNGKEGITALGVFSALCQYTATLPKELRGRLANSDGSPMDIEDISEITRMEVADIRHASGMLVACGWLTLMDKGICQDLPPICHTPANFPQGEGEGQEEEQGEGIKENVGAEKSKFIPPTIQEFIAYMQKALPEINPEWTPERITRACNVQFDTYVDQAWHTGGSKPRKIKIWGTTAKNSMKHLKPWNFGSAPKQQMSLPPNVSEYMGD